VEAQELPAEQQQQQLAAAAAAADAAAAACQKPQARTKLKRRWQRQPEAQRDPPLDLAGQLVRLMRVVQPGAVPAGCDAVRLLKLIGKGTAAAVYKGEWVKASAFGSSSHSSRSAQDVSSRAAAAAAAAELAGPSTGDGTAPSYVAVKVFGNFSGFFVQERRAGMLTAGIKNVVQTIATGSVERPTAPDGVAAGMSRSRSDHADVYGGSDDDAAGGGPTNEPFPCLVMGLCQGALERRKAHTEPEARHYIRPLLQALADLQQRGIVLR
jgi:serine/threonine protein kinase